MLGIRFVKTEPTVYVMHFRDGRLVQEGAGLTFLCFAPTSTIVEVPLNTTDLPFAFQEVTSDFQTVTLQGQMSYRVVDARRLAGLLNYAKDEWGKYQSDDPTKLPERLLIATQALMRELVQRLPLRQVIAASERLAVDGLDRVRRSALVAEHGLEVLALSLVSLRPTPEAAKALEAEAREALLREADQALYARRTAAVELERKVKETELDTERAVEEKKRRVREAQMEAEIAIEEKKRQVRETQMRADIAIEDQRAALMDLRVVNNRKDTDSRAYAIERTLAPYKDLDWRLLLTLGNGAPDGRMLMAQAFERFADNAGKIGQLNISPDFLTALASEVKK